ncbi:hypothetical protein BH11MYX1_BH11MYX1_03590 [soil metagenome]
MFSSVDLPLPEEPTIATISPREIENETPSSAAIFSSPIR